MKGCVCSVVILLYLALVAECSQYVQSFGQLEDDLGNEDLIFITKKPIHNNKSYGGPTTTLPNVGITTQEPRVTELDLEEEWLLPGFAAEEDLLRNRDKRAVEASGDGEPELNACLGLDTALSQDLTDTSNFKSNTEMAIFQKCKTTVTGLSGVEVLDFDLAKSIINFKLKFPSETNTEQSAQCLRDIQTQGSITIGSDKFLVTKDPLIENGANQLVAAICELCTAQQECILNVANLYFCGSTALFSTSQSAVQLTTADDAVDTISISSEIPFGSKLSDQFYVSSNGFVSTVNNPGPKSVALKEVDFDVLAVAWTDIDTRIHGDVSHRTYTNMGTVSAETQSVLDRASSDVQNYASKDKFEASTVIVVTWKEVSRIFGNETKYATFQLVLASDGLETYALYFYGDNTWQFTNDVIIGFRNSQETTTNQFSLSSEITSLQLVKGNTASNGIWIYKVGSVDENFQSKCSAFLAKEEKQKNLYQIRNRQVPRCPCSKFFLNWSYFQIIHTENFDRDCYIRRTFTTYTRLCCYEKSNNRFIRSDPYAGSLVKYNPLRNGRQYILEDYIPWDDCCIKTSKCRLFREVRPVQGCFFVPFFVLLFGFGDPHITTLDGYSYTFNGLGEFTFMKIGDFVVQMRAVRAIDAQGKQLGATVYGGFAVSVGNSESLQVQLSASRERLVIYVKGKDVSLDFYEKSDYFYELDNIISLKRSGNKSVEIVHSNGITLRISIEVRMLNIGLGVPRTFIKNGSEPAQASGLAGNYDGDKTNDIAYKNGTILPSEATDKEIHEAGMTWAVPESESLFTYQDGLEHKDFNDPTFTPRFRSEFTVAEISAASTVCNGTNNTFCIFDYTVTGDESIAANTNQLTTESEDEIRVIQNSIPEISIDTTEIKATVNEEISIKVTATDEDNDTVTITVEEKPATGFTFDSSTGIAKWTPKNNDTVTIGFLATDSKNAESPVSYIDITLCTSCSGHGECHQNETRNKPANNYFRLLKCVCSNGYEGEECESESDGCQYKPCDPLQNCTDIPGELPDGEMGYNCSVCPNGYITVNPQKCQDIDECVDDTICGTGGTCSNALGSYTCNCSAGYRLIEQKCEDIDECIDRTHDCEQLCNNTDGSFTCDCQDGFTTNGNQCEKAQNNCTKCKYGCKDDDGNETCLCKSTEEFNGTDCTDFDECTLNFCQQTCTNADPGFTCSCYDGFKLAADGLSCEACTGLRYGEECSKTCNCNGRGSCDPAVGCRCNSMWTGEDCTTDVNECTRNPNICTVGSLCINLPGSYECYCPEGYNKVNNECKDIDECTTNGDVCSGSNAVCVNNVGSYTCECSPGFLKDQDNNCTDIDECTEDVHGCEQTCENNIGSFNCKCKLGFTIQDDRKTCQQDPTRDPCSKFAPANCGYGCKEEGGQAVCFCQAGYILGADGTSCIDVDECDGNHGCSNTCVNSIGSYKCTCPNYNKLLNDKKTCTGCLSNEWGKDCLNTCDCSAIGSNDCTNEAGCQCKDGWTGVKCDQDQDECSVSGTCTTANSVCVNTPGSYQCNCNDGFERKAGKCEDINECSVAGTCEQICNNIIGSFYCSCDNGFIFNSNSNKCEDIDECSTGKSDCEQKCRNIAGGYVCECNTGFTIKSDRKTCRAETECDPAKNCTQKCAKISGNDTCSCKEFYQLNADEKSCDVIDPCDSDPCIDGNCTSNPPAFTCSCAPGLQLKNDDVTCEECPEGKYGQNCGMDCQCNTANTKSCNKVNGNCTCNDGWEGSTCNDDIDECIDTNTNNCASNTTCKNTNGSYICQCNSGSISVNGICQECPEGKYGQNCGEVCQCVTANTESCNKVNGNCTCADGWEGTTCNNDTDECTGSPCDSVPNSECKNSVGSYECNCNAGYTKVDGNCADVNECLRTNLNTCSVQNEDCKNTDGSFECKCKSGYVNDGQMCKECSEGKYGQNCGEVCQCVTANTESCNKVNGTCTCVDGWEGTTCSDDIDECSTGSPCNSVPNSECKNSVGSYQCKCTDGYTNVNSNCEDIDECAVNKADCEKNCTNTNGSFECFCPEGEELDIRDSKSCYAKAEETIENYSIELNITDKDIVNIVKNPTLFPNKYNKLKEDIGKAVLKYLRFENPGIIYVNVTKLSLGSIIAEMDIILRQFQSQNASALSKQFYDLLQKGELEINGNKTDVLGITTKDNITLTKESSKCEILDSIKPCDIKTEVCEVQDERPVCRPVSETSSQDLAMIIGLSVGIPIGFLLIAILSFCIYYCVNRNKRKNSERGQHPERRDPFKSVFTGPVPKRGGWAAANRYGLYSPDTLSAASQTSSDSDGKLINKARQKAGRTDFNDSAWNDNRSFSRSQDVAPGNFSWEHMFRALEPMRNFEIQRPNYQASPVYPFKSRRPDSLA